MNIIEAYFSDDEVENLGFSSIGKNVKIKKNVGIVGTENVSIGDNVKIDDFTMIMASGAPCRIGSYVHISAHCTIYGRAGFVMEDFSGLSPGVRIFTLGDDYIGDKLTNPSVPSKYTGGCVRYRDTEEARDNRREFGHSPRLDHWRRNVRRRVVVSHKESGSLGYLCRHTRTSLERP